MIIPLLPPTSQRADSVVKVVPIGVGAYGIHRDPLMGCRAVLTVPETGPGRLVERRDWQRGQRFIERLSGIVVAHLDEPDFTVEALAGAVGLSRVQLHRRLKALGSLNATVFIRNIRLSRAAELLAGRAESVTQVAYAVGFASLSYFASVFQEQYGVLPSQYSRQGGTRIVALLSAESVAVTGQSERPPS